MTVCRLIGRLKFRAVSLADLKLSLGCASLIWRFSALVVFGGLPPRGLSLTVPVWLARLWRKRIVFCEVLKNAATWLIVQFLSIPIASLRSVSDNLGMIVEKDQFKKRIVKVKANQECREITAICIQY